MDKLLKDKKAILFFIIPALSVYLMVVVLPLFMSIYYSLLKWDGIGIKKIIGINNYLNLFINNQDGFLYSLLNTLLLSFLTIAIQLPIALLLALILSQGVKGESVFRIIFFIPVILSSVVIGHLWKRIYDPNFGLLNHLLQNLGLAALTKTWLGERETALIAVCIPIIWQWIGYHMLLMYASAKTIPLELKEAALLEGASSMKIAVKITIPLMKPVLKICLILAVIGSLKTFDLVYILTNGGPAHASEVPSTLMVNTIFKKYQYGYGSTMAVFIVLECLLLTMAIQKLFRVEEITY